MEAVCFRRSNVITWGGGCGVNTCAEVGYRRRRKKGGGPGGVGQGVVRCGATTAARADLQRHHHHHHHPHPLQALLSFFPANLMTTSSSGETSPSLPWQLNVNQERESAAGRGGGRWEGEGRGGVMEFTPPHTQSVLAVHRASVTSSEMIRDKRLFTHFSQQGGKDIFTLNAVL